MRKIIERCPACGGDLVVTALRCSTCDTQIEGHFKPCRFCQLSEKTHAFIESFVRNRGNIREMERELRVSYPTVRNRLNEVIREMGYDSGGASQLTRREILRKLDEGKITAEEAIELLDKAEDS